MGEKRIVPGKGIEITKQDKRITVSQQGIEIRREGRSISAEVKEIGLVYLVVDCSASMGGDNWGDKLNQAKRGALNFAKDALAKGYLTGLIQFKSSATHLCEPQQEISVLRRYLKKIHYGGSTNMTEAIYLATQKLLKRSRFRVMVIATDGMPDNPMTALDAARKAKKDGIDIIAIGTDDANWEFLKKLASRTELGIKVSREKFEKGITSTAKMLPQLGPGKKGRR